MPNRKRTIQSQPYIPTGGVNFDSDSLAIAPNQCTDILNLRVFPNRLQTRSGSRRIAGQTPAKEPILHFHTYRDADGDERLFGFAQTGIYRYDDTTEDWRFALRTEVLDELDSIANLTSDFNTMILIGSGGQYSGTGAAYISPTSVVDNGQQFSTGDIILAQGGVGVMDWDLSPYNTFAFRLANFYSTSLIFGFDGPETIDIRCKFYSDDNFVTQVGGDCDATMNLVGSTAAFYYIEVPVTLVTPTAMTSVKSFEILANEDFFMRSAVALVFDYMTAQLRLGSTITRWEATSFTDNNKGTTVVAAGTVPPNPTEQEQDSASRVFMYYDRTLDYFRDIDTRSETRTVTDEVLDNGDGATVDWTLTAANPIVDKQSVTITYTVSSVTKTITDDGFGNLEGDVDAAGNNTIDYTTGDVDFKTDGAPDLNEPIEMDYTWYELITMKPRLVYNFHNRIVAANVWDGINYNPWKVFWSDTSNLEQYNQALSFSDLVDSDLSPIVGGNYMQKLLVLYREKSIVLCRFIGGTSVFQFQTQWHDGTFSGRTVAKWQNVHFYLGKDDVYMFDGSTSRRLAQDRIRNRIFDVLNNDQIEVCYGAIYPYHNEYWLWVVKQDETYPSTAFVYRIDMNAWTVFEFDETPAMGLYHTKSGTTIDELVGSIDEQNWTMDGGILDGLAEVPLISRDTGDVFAMDERVNSDYGYELPTLTGTTWVSGSAIPIRLATKDFIYTDLPRLDRTTRLHYEAVGTTVDISYSGDFGVTWKHTLTKTLEPQFKRHKYFLDTRAEKVRFRFAATATSQFFVIRWMQALGIVREKE